jgi:hypothetical protein
VEEICGEEIRRILVWFEPLEKRHDMGQVERGKDLLASLFVAQIILRGGEKTALVSSVREEGEREEGK